LERERLVFDNTTQQFLQVKNAIFELLPGYDMDIFDAALFKIFFDFVKASGGPAIPWTPIQAAILNNKQLYSVSSVRLSCLM